MDYKKAKYILGISCFYHDSAATLLKNGEVVAAAQEERFTRKKHDDSFPKNAIDYCLHEAQIKIDDLDYVIFYDKPLLKFERILETFITSWPKSFLSFLKAMPVWLKSKLWIKQIIQKRLNYNGPILFSKHHTSHAASAFYVSPFNEATVVTIDGVGEWETTTIGYGHGSDLSISKCINFPDSLGLFYSALTYYLGFKVNGGEYKAMGLAPYGNPEKYYDKVKKLIQLHDDGSYSLNQKYFAYTYGQTMTNANFDKLFDGKPRKPESPLTQKEKDIAASMQCVLEEAVLNIIKHAYRIHPSDNLCLAGGVALNCVANEKILKNSQFKNVFIQPAAGDAGGALGAALYLWHAILKNPKENEMKNAFLGPSFSNEEIERSLKKMQIPFLKKSQDEIIEIAALLLAKNHVIGWFQGRMEYGPRALGNRSILADPRDKKNWQRVNLKVKFRESFRPFAPSVLEDRSHEYFDGSCPNRFMLITAPVKRPDIPAVTHVNNSARLQTVNRDENKKYYDLIQRFENFTNCPVVINTSFNVRGEPIVCTPTDAIKCFLNTDIDYLFMENYMVSKNSRVA